MNEQIKTNLFRKYLQSLKDSIVIDELFHVDVEVSDGEDLYEMSSTMFAESSEIRHYDPLMPPEYSKLCLSCAYCMIWCSDEQGNFKTYEREAKEIVSDAINEIK